MAERAREQVLCGRHAVLAALATRPAALLRLFLTREHTQALSVQLQQLARRRVAYRVVTAQEIERICGSRAHQGLCAVVVPPKHPQAGVAELRRIGGQPGVWLALDGVGNPHNLGAIARTAAFLGASGLLIAQGDSPPIASGAAYRTAEGALETLPVWVVADMAKAIGAFGEGGGQAAALCLLDAQPLGVWRPPRGRGILLVAGAEETGVRADVRAACGAAVRIDGSGAVESLNVGVAVAIALAHVLALGGPGV